MNAIMAQWPVERLEPSFNLGHQCLRRWPSALLAMKFGEILELQAYGPWREHYVNYPKLKRLIARLAERVRPPPRLLFVPSTKWALWVQSIFCSLGPIWGPDRQSPDGRKGKD